MAANAIEDAIIVVSNKSLPVIPKVSFTIVTA